MAPAKVALEMGHLRLGRLPKTRRWRQVIELLGTAEPNVSAISRSVLFAAENELRTLGRDPSVAYAFWVLTRITYAARAYDFDTQLSELGFPLPEDPSTLAFIASLTDRMRFRLGQETEAGQYPELVTLAVRRTLTETIGTQGPSLFGSSVEDLQEALRSQSTQVQFGALTQRFFGDLLARTLTSYLDREIASVVEPGDQSSMEVSDQLLSEIETHARQSALILRDFAGGWYSKHNWQARGEVTRDEAERFARYALRKLRSEMAREAAS